MDHKMQVSTRFSSEGTASWQLISSYTHCNFITMPKLQAQYAYGFISK